MSDEPQTWASKDAPTKDPYEHSVLTVMAQAADEDGCNSLLSAATIAERAKMSVREVRDNVRELLARGLIGYGDQSVASYIRADRRPVVYDLLIPHAWFGPQPLARINRFRAERGGRPPLLAESCDGQPCAARRDDETGPRCGHRPPIMDAPPRKRRSDAGQKRARRDGVTGSPPVHGVTVSPPGLPNAYGVNTNSSDHGLSPQVTGGDPPPRGAYNAPNLLTSKELTSSSSGEDLEQQALTPSPESLEEEEGSPNPKPLDPPDWQSVPPELTGSILDEVLALTGVPAARRPAGQKRAGLLGGIRLAVEAGWSPTQLVAGLGAEPLDNVRSVFAVLTSRIVNLGPAPTGGSAPAQRRRAPGVGNDRLARAAADCDRCDPYGFLPHGGICGHEPVPDDRVPSTPDPRLVFADAG